MDRFNVIFYLPNGENWCPKGCCRDESWDSEFEYELGLTQEQALRWATTAVAHPRFECAEGVVHITPETPTPEAIALSNTIGEQAKLDAKEVVKQRAEAKAQDEVAKAQRAAAEREARERAELERLRGKYETA